MVRRVRHLIAFCPFPITAALGLGLLTVEHGLLSEEKLAAHVEVLEAELRRAPQLQSIKLDGMVVLSAAAKRDFDDQFGGDNRDSILEDWHNRCKESLEMPRKENFSGQYF